MVALMLLLAVGISDNDGNAAIMYAQSYSMPAMFDVCKSSMPDRAKEFDVALAGWKKKNAATLAKGEAVVRKEAGTASADIEVIFSTQRDSMVSQLKSLNQQERATRCEYMLQITRSEQ